MYSETTDKLMRLSVVAACHSRVSTGKSVAIKPDQSIRQIIENERRVSSARNTIGREKNLPAWAIVQHSNLVGRCNKSCSEYALFIKRSAIAQIMISHPAASDNDPPAVPVRSMLIPKIIL